MISSLTYCKDRQILPRFRVLTSSIVHNSSPRNPASSSYHSIYLEHMQFDFLMSDHSGILWVLSSCYHQQAGVTTVFLTVFCFHSGVRKAATGTRNRPLTSLDFQSFAISLMSQAAEGLPFSTDYVF